jgi:hypothetical protein
LVSSARRPASTDLKRQRAQARLDRFALQQSGYVGQRQSGRVLSGRFEPDAALAVFTVGVPAFTLAYVVSEHANIGGEERASAAGTGIRRVRFERVLFPVERHLRLVFVEFRFHRHFLSAELPAERGGEQDYERDSRAEQRGDRDRGRQADQRLWISTRQKRLGTSCFVASYTLIAKAAKTLVTMPRK